MFELNISSKAILQNTQEARDKLAAADALVNNYYHILELVPLNAAKTMKLTKALKEALKSRRLAKEEACMWQSLSDNLLKPLRNFEKRTLSGEREQKYFEESLKAAKELSLL